jgi:putative nucleotidyltransferase with HDIG domain
MKIKHSIYVAREMESLACCLGLNEMQTRLAKLIGLLHDVGRFQQFGLYGTFVDTEAVDHGEMGSHIMREEGVLDGIGADTQILIERAIRHHNRARLPEDDDAECPFFSRLLRDADKLDIYRVIIAH